MIKNQHYVSVKEILYKLIKFSFLFDVREQQANAIMGRSRNSSTIDLCIYVRLELGKGLGIMLQN